MNKNKQPFEQENDFIATAVLKRLVFTVTPSMELLPADDPWPKDTSVENVEIPDGYIVAEQREIFCRYSYECRCTVYYNNKKEIIRDNPYYDPCDDDDMDFILSFLRQQFLFRFMGI